MFGGLETSSSGMQAQRIRMDVITANIANADTTSTADGGPYRRRQVVFQTILQEQSREPRGVEAVRVVDDMSPFPSMEDDGHPHAVDGVVRLPNVEPVLEMADLTAAARAYEANAAAFKAYRDMVNETLRLWST